MAEPEKLADILHNAQRGRHTVPMLTAGDAPGLTIEDAYTVQAALVQLRLASGEQVTGMKMGLTSSAKMKQVGVDEPIYGVLTDAMLAEDGGVIRRADLIHPRIEPEIAFVLKDDLHGPATVRQALAAVAGVCAALEVIDSRYQDFKFTMPDVVADNTSASRFIVGTPVPVPAHLDNLGIVLEINGVVVETASSAAVLDNPARSLAALATMLARRGGYLRAGQVILSGGATAAVAINPGDTVRAVIDAVGTATVVVE